MSTNDPVQDSTILVDLRNAGPIKPSRTLNYIDAIGRIDMKWRYGWTTSFYLATPLSSIFTNLN